MTSRDWRWAVRQQTAVGGRQAGGHCFPQIPEKEVLRAFRRRIRVDRLSESRRGRRDPRPCPPLRDAELRFSSRPESRGPAEVQTPGPKRLETLTEGRLEAGAALSRDSGAPARGCPVAGGWLCGPEGGPSGS